MGKRAKAAEKISAAAGSPAPRTLYLAVGALVLMSIIWGYNFVATKVGLRYAEPAIYAALRTFPASVLLFLILVILRRPLRPGNLRLTLCVGLLQTGGSIGLWTWAMASGAAGKTGVLVYTMPFWLLLLSAVILKERLRGPQWFSVALAFAGLCLVLAPWGMHGTLLSRLLAVASGIAWAAGTVGAKVLCGRYRVDILSLNAWQMLLGSIPLVIVAVAVTDSSPVWSSSFIGALLFSIIPSTVLGLLLWFYALRTLSAGIAGLATLATPVLGIVFAWIQLGERMDRYETAGIILILASLGALALMQIVAGRRAERIKGLG